MPASAVVRRRHRSYPCPTFEFPLDADRLPAGPRHARGWPALAVAAATWAPDMRFQPIAMVAAALAPTAAFAVDYLSAEQAQRLMFPDADRFETRELTLDAAALKRLDEQGLRARSARWTVRLARRGGDVLGYVVVDDVVGKFELISYAVGLGADGHIRQVEVLSYRESHGQEIRSAAWRRQFVGKDAGSTLRVGDDIANLSGATLSCEHLTDGVRRIVNVLDLARRGGGLA